MVAVNWGQQTRLVGGVGLDPSGGWKHLAGPTGSVLPPQGPSSTTQHPTTSMRQKIASPIQQLKYMAAYCSWGLDAYRAWTALHTELQIHPARLVGWAPVNRVLPVCTSIHMSTINVSTRLAGKIYKRRSMECLGMRGLWEKVPSGCSAREEWWRVFPDSAINRDGMAGCASAKVL